MNNEKFNTLMYFMTKEVAREGFCDFLEYHDVTEDEWEEMKEVLKETFGTKTYC